VGFGNNIKSIESVKLDLGDLTILLGPSAAGKSNILDALGIVGYLHRFKLLDKEYANNALNLEPLTLIARFQEVSQLFRYNDISKPVRIRVSGNISLNYEISYVSGSLKVIVNEKPLPWDLCTLRPDPMGELQNISKQIPILETRLYGFDPYGLAIGTCINPQPCGLHLHLLNISKISVIATLEPSLARILHIAAPIPRAPPVTTTTFPSTLPLLSRIKSTFPSIYSIPL
jgi:hypothetical protein